MNPVSLDDARTTEAAFAVDGIVADALASVPDADPDSLAFLDGLVPLAHSFATEAGLAPDAVQPVRGALVSALRTQLQLAAARRDEPAIATTPVGRPVFLIGMLRTGSTLLHNLLAQHPGLRVPALWELQTAGDPSRDPERHELLAETAQSYVDEYYRVAPALPSVHFIDARRPDECHRLLCNTFRSMVYEARYRVPSYAEWLHRQDLTAAYGYHRMQLQALLWRIPGDPVVLKCPFHLWHLRELATVYPEARFVHLHRHPVEAVVSTCSLCEVIRGARTRRIDRHEIGRQWFDNIRRVLWALPEGRTYLGDRVLDVSYPELMADPVATVGRICDFVGVPLTGAAEAGVRRFLAENPQRKHGSHRYAASDYGLDEREITETFGDYIAEYGLYDPRRTAS